MRWTTYAIAIPLGCFVLAANINPAAAQQRPDHQERDAVTNTVFSSRVDEQGNARITAKVADFTLEKIVASGGDATIRLVQGKDVVSVAMNQSGYVVGRGKNTASFDPRTGTPDDLDAIQAVLLGSQAVRTFRTLSASFEDREDTEPEGPLFLSTLVDGAVVEMLDGDPGATTRVGKRIQRRHRAGLQQARLLPDHLFADCILNYEMSLLNAWDLFNQCTETTFSFAWYFWWSAETFCEFEFLARSQQYIYQYISCNAYPF